MKSLKHLRELLFHMQVRWGAFLFSVFLSVVATFLHLFVLNSILDLSNGLIRGQFDFVRKLSLPGEVIQRFPQHFSSELSLFLLLVLVTYAASILKNLASYASAVSMNRMVASSARQIRRLLFSRYLSFGKLYFDQIGIGHLNHVLMYFSAEVTGQLTALHGALGQLLLLITYVYFMVKISLPLTGVVGGILIGMTFFSRGLVKKVREGSHFLAQSQLETNRKILNLLMCVPLVKSYAREREELNRFDHLSAAEVEASFRMTSKTELAKPIEELSIMTALVLVAAVIGYLSRTQHAIPVGEIFVFFYLVRNCVPAFSSLHSYRLTLARAAAPLVSLTEVLSDNGKPFVKAGTREFTGLTRQFRFQKMNFQYQAQVPVLREFSLSLKKGEITALVGPTGAGKSTVAHLLMRFYDCPAGTLKIDGIDIREFSLESLMKRMAFVGQDIQLFNDTIRNNLLYGLDREVSKAEMREVLAKSMLLDLVKSLPDKMETLIGDRGIKLSGGERQRLSIARALLKKADVLILDEATSALDSRTESLIQKAIETVVEGKTALVIAHRLSTIQNAQHIVVMEKGRVVEEGTLAELLGRRGKFYDYWQAQNLPTTPSEPKPSLLTSIGWALAKPLPRKEPEVFSE